MSRARSARFGPLALSAVLGLFLSAVELLLRLRLRLQLRVLVLVLVLVLLEQAERR